MNKSHQLGMPCIAAIAFASAFTSSNDPHLSNLLNAVFIISCGAIGIWLLRKINASENLG